MPERTGDVATALADLVAWLRPAPPPTFPPGTTQEAKLREYLHGVRQYSEDEAKFQRMLVSLPPAADVGQWTQLLGGAVVGAAEGAAQEVADTVAMLEVGIEALLEFYAVSYDPAMWRAVLNAWNDPSDMTPVLRTIEANHPDLHKALISFRPFAKKLDELNARLKGADAKTVFLTVFGLILGTVADELTQQAEKIASHKGDPFEQGRPIGVVVGRMVVATISICSKVYPIAAAAARKTGKLTLLRARRKLKPRELKALADELNRMVPGVMDTGIFVGRTRDEVQKIYQRLANRIQRHGTLKQDTRTFNWEVRLLHDLTENEAEALNLLLNSHHIIRKAPYLTAFKADFKRRLGWASEDDMDAIALTMRWHQKHRVRRLLEEQDLEGLEGVQMLHDELDSFLTARSKELGGFDNLEELIQAHEDAYRSFAYPKQGDAVNLRGQPISPQLYDGVLKPWFDDIKAKLKKNP